jgi:DNA modification methylase
MITVEIKKIKLSQVKLNPDNPRRIGSKEMEHLVKSLKEFPEMMRMREIVVDEKMIILGGNMRVLALRKAGEKEVTAKICRGLTEDQKREFIIKDNGFMGEWDFDALANSWSDLPLVEWGIDLPDFWNAQGDPEAHEDDFDADAEAKKIENPITKKGDIWLLEKHRIMCGDSINNKSVERLLNGKKADMVFTDPPYGINVVKVGGGGKTKFGKVGGDTKWASANYYRPIYGDDKEFDPSFLMNHAKKILLFGGNYYSNLLPISRCWLIWDKTGDQYIQNNFADCELIWTNLNKLSRIYRCKWRGLLKEKGEDLKKRIHPTQKPIKLLTDIIFDYSKENEIIEDLFLGSGSTLIACEQLGRICYGMEIDPVYCDVIVKRWEQFTGKKAVLEK